MFLSENLLQEKTAHFRIWMRIEQNFCSPGVFGSPEPNFDGILLIRNGAGCPLRNSFSRTTSSCQELEENRRGFLLSRGICEASTQSWWDSPLQQWDRLCALSEIPSSSFQELEKSQCRNLHFTDLTAFKCPF